MSDLATAARLCAGRRRSSPLPGIAIPRVFDAEQRLLFARAPGYVGHELMVPEAGDYYALPARDNAQALVRNAAGRRAPVERLPPPAGDHAEGPRQRAEHRLPDPSLDLRPQGRAARRAAFRRQAVPEPRAARRCRTGTACCSTARATSARDLARARRATGSTSRATCSTTSTCTSATTTGRRSSRSTSRTITSARSIRASASSSPATTSSGNSPTGRTCSSSASTTAWRSRARRPTSAGTRRCSTSTAASTPPHGAIWLTYYPNVMVEWYPHVLVVSTLIPRGRPHDQRRRVLLSRGDRAVRARVRRRPSRRRTRRPRARTTRSPSGWTPAAARSSRRAAARSGRTSRRWKTACSTSTSSTAADGHDAGGL